MSIPSSEPLLPEDENHLPPARRRRVRRSLLPAGGDERAAFLEQLAHQVTPGYEFFLFTFFSRLDTGRCYFTRLAGFLFAGCAGCTFSWAGFGPFTGGSGRVRQVFPESVGQPADRLLADFRVEPAGWRDWQSNPAG